MFYSIDLEHGSHTKKIYNKEELSTAIFNSIEYYENQIARLKEQNDKLIADAAAVVRAQYEQEIANLKHSLSLSYGEFYTEKEKSDYLQFVEDHMHDRETSKYNGGRAPFLIPHYNGIGRTLNVVCQICGKSKDITDMEAW